MVEDLLKMSESDIEVASLTQKFRHYLQRRKNFLCLVGTLFMTTTYICLVHKICMITTYVWSVNMYDMEDNYITLC